MAGFKSELGGRCTNHFSFLLGEQWTRYHLIPYVLVFAVRASSFPCPLLKRRHWSWPEFRDILVCISQCPVLSSDDVAFRPLVLLLLLKQMALVTNGCHWVFVCLPVTYSSGNPSESVSALGPRIEQSAPANCTVLWSTRPCLLGSISQKNCCHDLCAYFKDILKCVPWLCYTSSPPPPPPPQK